MTEILQVYLALCVIALGAVAVDVRRTRARRRKVLSYCQRSSDGEPYVQDPKTGTMHKFADLLAKRLLGEQQDVTPRQKRKGRRRFKAAARA